MKKSNRKLANDLGISHTLIQRKRKQGASDQEIAERAAAGTAPDLPGESFTAAQARKERALADLRELEVKTKSGALIEVAAVRQAWSDHISRARSSLLGLGNELGDKLATVSDPIRVRQLIEAKISEVLTELSRYDGT